jgi:hypothetical protein
MTTPDAPGGHSWTWPLVIASGLLLALRFGFNFGIGNHNTYLCHALQQVHPELLARDWLVSTQDFHPIFTQLAALLLRLDGSGWLFAVMNVLCITMSAIVVFLIVREVAGERLAVPAYLLVVALMGVGSTYSASGSYLFSMTFQPSTLAATGYLLAVLWFLRRKVVASGLALAVAGAFHVNFAVLAFPLFALAHVFSGRGGWLRRSVVQLAPVCLTLAALSPLLLSQSQSPYLDQARFIYQQVLSPQHYLPRTFWTEFVVFFAWCGLGVVAGWGLFSDTPSARRLRALWLSSLLLVTVATLLTTVVFLPAVSQLYVWRLAPFAVLFSQILGAVGLVRHLSSEDSRLPAARRTLVLVLCAVLIWLTFRYHYGEFRFLQYGLLIALALIFYLRPLVLRISPLRERSLTAVTVAGVWLAAALVPAASLASRSNLISGLPAAEAELYQWAATAPESAVFLIPPQLENFRFNARRAVVVDFKSTPVDPGQLLEWYHRLGAVCGDSGVGGFQASVSGWAQLDSARLTALAESYPFDYVVVLADQTFTGASGYTPAFANRAFRAYRR